MEEPIPPTLADIRDYGVDVFCWCNRCHHHSVVPISVLIAHCGPGLPFPEVHGRLRCQACGSKDIHARPNWKGLGGGREARVVRRVYTFGIRDKGRDGGKLVGNSRT